MGLITINDESDGTSADANDLNSRFAIVTGLVNGNIDNANIKNGGVTAVNLASGAVTTDKIADASIGKAKVDFTTSGGIWWEELGRTTTIAIGDSIQVNSFATRRHLKIIVHGLASGSIQPQVTFNGDTGNNYSFRRSLNGAADTTASGVAVLPLGDGTPAATSVSCTIEIANFGSTIKMVRVSSTRSDTIRAEITGTWTSASPITSINIINAGTGDFSVGSSVVVLGHD